jgi:hypothetical protein
MFSISQRDIETVMELIERFRVPRMVHAAAGGDALLEKERGKGASRRRRAQEPGVLEKLDQGGRSK